MKLSSYILALALTTGCTATLACEPARDGCMGCNDEQLLACLDTLVNTICESGGTLNRCDQQRAFDDAERHVLISRGNHMSHIRSMMRSARKYQHR